MTSPSPSAEPQPKGDQAFRTIGELAEELGLPQHILRYWETRFPQLRPLQRAGKRRYYRPADVALARRIHRLLNQEGYTIRGVQKLLVARTPDEAEVPEAAVPAPVIAHTPVEAAPAPVASVPETGASTAEIRPMLLAIRATLIAALRES